MEPEPQVEYDEDAIITAVPEKKRTLTAKQLKNLELRRQKKMAKKEAAKMISDSVRNSAREADAEEFSSLKNELEAIKKKLAAPPPEKTKSKKSVPARAVPEAGRPTNKVRCPTKRIVQESESDSDEGVEYSNPYLMQIVRPR